MNFVPTIEKIPLDHLLTGVITVSSRNQEVISSAAELIKNKSANCTNSKELQSALFTHYNTVHAKMQAKESISEAEITEVDWLEWDVIRMALDLVEITCSNATYEFI